MEKAQKKKRKGELTKERIHKCAMELFTSFGFENVTIVQICEAAGVTKRTF